MKTDVSLLGTGLLGAPVARRLHSTGLSVTVWNRTRERAEALAAPGLHVAATAAEAIAASPVSVLLLADARAIRGAVLTAPALQALRGRALVQMGTIGPDECRSIGAAAEAAGAEWLEAPVLGSIPQAASGTLQVLVGGTPEQLRRHDPLLRRLGPDPVLVGPVGQAATLKLALNQLIGSLTAAFATSLALVRASGIDPALFLSVLRPSALYAPTFDKKLDRMLEDRYDDPNFPARHLLKDVRLVVAAAASSGVDASVPRAVGSILERALAGDLGDLDYSVIARVVATG